MRFEIPFMLAFASAALAGSGTWTMERHQSDDCSDPQGGSVIGADDADSDKCRPMYIESDAADKKDRDNLPTIKSVKVTWTDDIKAYIYHRGGCDRQVRQEITKDGCIKMWDPKQSHVAYGIESWRFTNGRFW